MAKKVVQHFISKFMLKRWENQGKRILIFNGQNRRYITVGESKRYFADKYLYEKDRDNPDAKLEDRLSNIERDFSMLSSKIINDVENGNGHNFNDNEIALIETFCYLQEMRNKDYIDFYGDQKNTVLDRMNAFIDSYKSYIGMNKEEKKKLTIEAKSIYDNLYNISKAFPGVDVYNSLDYERAKLYENPKYFLAIHGEETFRFIAKKFNNNLPLPGLGALAIAQKTGLGKDDRTEFVCIPLSPDVGILKFASFNATKEQKLIDDEFNGSEQKQDKNLLKDSFTELFIKTKWAILPPKFTKFNLKREFLKYKKVADIGLKGPDYTNGRIKEIEIKPKSWKNKK